MKTAVVTGSSSGIGRAICDFLLKADFKVYGISRISGDINNANFIWIKADLTDPEAFGHIASSISEANISVLVNDAGIAFEKESMEFNGGDFDRTFDINFKAPILLTQALRQKLQRGSVINISSVSDRLVGERYALYCSSKAALNIYFDVIALEEKNIKFVSILPSYVDTPLLRKLQEHDKGFDWGATIKPPEVAEFVDGIINHKVEIPNGARVIVVSDALKEDLNYSENLWGYNVTTRELSPLNQS